MSEKEIKSLEEIKSKLFFIDEEDGILLHTGYECEEELEDIEKAVKVLDIIRNCLVGEYEVLDNCSIDNAFKSPYRLRIYMDDTTFNEWILKDKEEYDLVKEGLKDE